MTDRPARSALVTGASSGIGRAIALALASAGYAVALVARDTSRLAEVITEIEATGGRCESFEADLTDTSRLRPLADSAAAALGRLDVVVNAAGVFYRATLAEANNAAFDNCMAVNVRAPYFLTQACVPHLAATGKGKVVNIGSIAGEVGFPEASAYCASKAALVGMTKALAYELAPLINVNCVSPHNIVTPMNEVALTRDAAYREAQLRDSPIGRLGSVNDVSPAVLYLASDAADYVTGITLFVDGGWLTH